MDTVKYSKDRFHEIKKQITQYLKKVGDNLEKVQFVPDS